MPSTITHYDVLGISEDASQSDIKAAFGRQVREHPPEQDPEGYKLVREAYDVLSNPVSRREYDNMSTFGDEIEQLKEEAEQLLNRRTPDVDGAIRKLKKAVVLGPEIGLLRNQLGNCYLQNEQPERALRQFEKAIDINSENAAYKLNRGHALRDAGRLNQAEHAFRTVWEANEGDYAAARALAGVLFDQEDVEGAHEVLDIAIWADDKLDFEDFFCYYDKLQLYLLKGNTEALEEELETVKKLPETPEDRKFAAYMLARTGYQLYDLKVFELAQRFTDVALQLNPHDPELQDMADHVQELSGLEQSLKEIIDSSSIHDVVKHVMAVFYEQAVGAVSETEAGEEIDEILSGLDNIMRIDPPNKEIKSSLRRIRSQYPEAYKLHKGLFDAIIDSPPAHLISADCPHCRKTVTAPKNDTSVGACPHCNGQIKPSGDSIEAAGGCFIATAVYGDYEHRDVKALRRFRDDRLAEWAVGQWFIEWYYRNGPSLARALDDRPFIRKGVRRSLSLIVRAIVKR